MLGCCSLTLARLLQVNLETGGVQSEANVTDVHDALHINFMRVRLLFSVLACHCQLQAAAAQQKAEQDARASQLAGTVCTWPHCMQGILLHKSIWAWTCCWQSQGRSCPFSQTQLNTATASVQNRPMQWLSCTIPCSYTGRTRGAPAGGYRHLVTGLGLDGQIIAAAKH